MGFNSGFKGLNNLVSIHVIGGRRWGQVKVVLTAVDRSGTRDQTFEQ